MARAARAHFIQPMRACGAAMRQMLAGARRQTLERRHHRGPRRKNHEVVHKSSGKKFGYGELAADATAMPMPALDQITVKDAKDFRYIGKGKIKITDLRDITVGQGALRSGRGSARHDVRGGRPSAGGRRQGGEIRRQRRDEGAGRS